MSRYFRRQRKKKKILSSLIKIFWDHDFHLNTFLNINFIDFGVHLLLNQVDLKYYIQRNS